MKIFSKWFERSDLGRWGEERVADDYRQRGWRILEKNYFNRHGRRVGEIDLVATKDTLVAFVEVKTRTSGQFGAPREAVTFLKQQRLVRACKRFLYAHPEFADYMCRIDVAEVKTSLDRKTVSVTILENAVQDSG